MAIDIKPIDDVNEYWTVSAGTTSQTNKVTILQDLNGGDTARVIFPANECTSLSETGITYTIIYRGNDECNSATTTYTVPCCLDTFDPITGGTGGGGRTGYCDSYISVSYNGTNGKITGIVGTCGEKGVIDPIPTLKKLNARIWHRLKQMDGSITDYASSSYIDYDESSSELRPVFKANTSNFVMEGAYLYDVGVTIGGYRLTVWGDEDDRLDDGVVPRYTFGK